MNAGLPRAPHSGATLAFAASFGGAALALSSIDPTIAFLLLICGLVAVLVELTHPGGILPGLAGAVLLCLGLVSLIGAGAWPALAIILVGFASMTLPALTRLRLTLAPGVIVFALGSLILTRESSISAFVAFPVTVLAGAVMLAVLRAAERARHWPVKVGPEALVGALGVVRDELAPVGFVQVHGELWQARSLTGVFASGDRVRVARLEGLTLLVVPDAPGQMEDLRLADQHDARLGLTDRVG